MGPITQGVLRIRDSEYPKHIGSHKAVPLSAHPTKLGTPVGHGSLSVGVALNPSCQSLKAREAVRSQAITTSDGVSRGRDRARPVQGGVAPGARQQGGHRGTVGTTAHRAARAPLRGCGHSSCSGALRNDESGVARFLSFSREARFLDFYCEVLTFLNAGHYFRLHSAQWRASPDLPW